MIPHLDAEYDDPNFVPCWPCVEEVTMIRPPPQIASGLRGGSHPESDVFGTRIIKNLCRTAVVHVLSLGVGR
jgi:hypothetical protein